MVFLLRGIHYTGSGINRPPSVSKSPAGSNIKNFVKVLAVTTSAVSYDECTNELLAVNDTGD